jgi:hemin uptake protein HemP
MNSQRPKDTEGNTAEPLRKSTAGARNIAVVDHRIDSRDLFIATREVTIGHGGDVYRLRLTAQNKLILTK